MALQPDRRYTGRVVEGALMESSRMTPGFQIIIDYDGGTTDFIIWLTAKNKRRAERDFETLGITDEMLKSRAGWNYEIPSAVVGREVMFGTVNDEYNGETRVKVSWIGKPGAASAEALAASVASFFGGESASVGYSRNAGEPADLAAALPEDDAPPF